MEHTYVFDWKSTVSRNGSVITEYDFPVLPQEKACDAKELFEEFCEQFERSLETYRDKRFEVSGIAVKIGPDLHGKPSIELSDCPNGKCHVLFVFESENDYKNVKTGERITCRGNYLGVTNEFGVVMKRSEIVQHI